MVEVPKHLLDVPYVGNLFPGAPGVHGIDGGANCQQFAYELLRHFGRIIPDFRSSDLWEDQEYTVQVTEFEPLDLILFHDIENPYGAHVAVYLGEGKAIHLSERIGKPVIWSISKFQLLPEYRILIGAKRAIKTK